MKMILHRPSMDVDGWMWMDGCGWMWMDGWVDEWMNENDR